MTASTQRNQTHDQAASDRSVRRIKQLLLDGMSQAEMVETLNREGYKTIRLQSWSVTNLKQVLFRLRHELKTWYGLSARRANLVVVKAEIYPPAH